MFLKKNTYQRVGPMVFCTILATFSLLNTIIHKTGALKYAFIAVLVCLLIATALLCIISLKGNNEKKS